MLVLVQANPGDPALCLCVSHPSQVAPSATFGHIEAAAAPRFIQLTAKVSFWTFTVGHSI